MLYSLYQRAFKGVEMMDTETKDMFHLLLTEIKGTRADVADLKTELDEVKDRLTNVENRLDKIEVRLDNVENRLDKIEVRLDNVENRLDKIEVRLDRVENRLDNVDVRLDNVENRLSHVEADLAETKEMHVETLRLCKALMHGNELLQAQQDAMLQDIAQLQGRQKQYDAAILMLNSPA